MSRKESDFLKRLLVTFQGEADERLRSLASGLIELEKATENATEAGNQAEVVEQVFREVHSLKGAARSVNLMEIEAVCQAMEDVFAAMKRQKITPSLPLLDTLHQATDLLKSLLSTIHTATASQDKARHAPLIRQLKELAKQSMRARDPSAPVIAPAPPPATDSTSTSTPPPTPITPAPAPEAEPTAAVQGPEELSAEEIEGDPSQTPAALDNDWQLEAATQSQPPPIAPHPIAPHPIAEERVTLATETVRIATARLESLLLQVEELVAAKLAVGQRAAELRELHAPLDLWDKRWAKLYPVIRTITHPLQTLDKADETSALLEFLEWNHTWVEQMDTRVTAIANAANRDQRAIGGMVDHLLQDMKQVLMLPFSSILEIFPSATRDLARQQEKEVQLVMRGAEIEVDRRILQEVKDPLMHLVRNCIDHGVEAPEARERRGKPRRGTITLTVIQRDSSKFEILVADDGGGIDLAKVRNSAARLGLISVENAERMGDQETKALIFQSGLSTSPLITDISGRGLGLAIVQEKVEKLGGVITLETETTQGTSFRLLLPLTLATLRGLLVQSDGQTLILPIIHVESVARLSRSEIQTVQNRETVRLAGDTYSLVRLGQALELPVKSVPHQPNAHQPNNRLFVVILSAAEKRIAFWVDEIIGEQEVLMKPLGAQLARVRNIAGATVLGNGQVIPIINVSDLIKSAIRTLDASPDAVEATPAQDKNILIVEDSITARMQLKNILELNGYTVTSAVDGLDALMMLRSESFDLVVSDVDMPRLNGLDLTSRIRNDKKLADLPVVLVTTLASRQDQERGIEVGANAYITKSNFDQNKLLDAIRRLI